MTTVTGTYSEPNAALALHSTGLSDLSLTGVGGGDPVDRAISGIWVYWNVSDSMRGSERIFTSTER